MLSPLWRLAVSWNLNIEGSRERREERGHKGNPTRTEKELAISGSPSLVSPTSAFPEIPNFVSQRPPTWEGTGWTIPSYRADFLRGTEFVNSLHPQTSRDQNKFILLENRVNTIAGPLAASTIPSPSQALLVAIRQPSLDREFQQVLGCPQSVEGRTSGIWSFIQCLFHSRDRASSLIDLPVILLNALGSPLASSSKPA